FQLYPNGRAAEATVLRRARPSLPTQKLQCFWQFSYRAKQQLRPRGAQTFLRGKAAEHCDGADACAASRLQILGRSRDVYASSRAQAHQPESQAKWRRMWFLVLSIAAANASGKQAHKTELAQLVGDTIAITARHKA